MSTEPKLKRLAIAWLLEADWPRWLELDADFQPSYQHYLKRMTTTYDRLKAQGVNVIKVEIRPADFLVWTRANGGGVDTHARAHFAAMKAMAMDLN